MLLDLYLTEIFLIQNAYSYISLLLLHLEEYLEILVNKSNRLMIIAR